MVKNTRPPQILRFPCGHLEDWPSVATRTRETPRAAWVGCRFCNVVAVTLAPAGRGARQAAISVDSR